MLLLGQLEMGGCMEELGLAVLELLLVMNGDLLLDHHLLLQVDLLLLLDQRVWLDLRICSYTNMEWEKSRTQKVSNIAARNNIKKAGSDCTGFESLSSNMTDSLLAEDMGDYINFSC